MLWQKVHWFGLHNWLSKVWFYLSWYWWLYWILPSDSKCCWNRSALCLDKLERIGTQMLHLRCETCKNSKFWLQGCCWCLTSLFEAPSWDFCLFQRSNQNAFFLLFPAYFLMYLNWIWWRHLFRRFVLRPYCTFDTF